MILRNCIHACQKPQKKEDLFALQIKLLLVASKPCFYSKEVLFANGREKQYFVTQIRNKKLQ